MNRFGITKEQDQIIQLVRQISEEQIRPNMLQWDEEEAFPAEVVDIFAKSGLFGINIPREYGGFGDSLFTLCLVLEEISKVDAGFATIYLASHLGVTPIIRFGTPAQKEKYLRAFAKGELFAFGLTEVNAGSDISGIATIAKDEGDHYVLNGTKQFISNAGVAGVYVIFAYIDSGKGSKRLGAFIVEDGQEGLSFGRKEKKLGIRCSPTREIILENCKVPKENLLGEKTSQGLRAAIKTFEETRLIVAAQAVGLAQGAFDCAVKFTKEREQFGKKIADFQGLQWMIADMSIKIETARTFVYHAAKTFDDNTGFTKAMSSQAKVYASDVAVEVSNQALQLMGGYGYIKDYPIEKYLRDAKITQIYEGTNQVLKNAIAQSVVSLY